MTTDQWLVEISCSIIFKHASYKNWWQFPSHCGLQYTCWIIAPKILLFMMFNMSQMIRHNRENKDNNNETSLNQNPAWNNLINLAVHQWSHELEKSVYENKCGARWRSCWDDNVPELTSWGFYLNYLLTTWVIKYLLLLLTWPMFFRKNRNRKIFDIVITSLKSLMQKLATRWSPTPMLQTKS